MPGPKASETERKEQILEAAYRVAARDRLEGLSTRRVAGEAGLSHGLVFFHFKTRDALLVALLDRLLERLELAEGTALEGTRTGTERLLALLRRELARLPGERITVELFFDYWVAGTRHPEIRDRMRRALERYRALFLPYATEAVREAPERFAGISAEGLAAVAVSFIQGCAVQAVMDAERFDVERYAATAEGLVAGPGTAV